MCAQIKMATHLITNNFVINHNLVENPIAAISFNTKQVCKLFMSKLIQLPIENHFVAVAK